MSFDHAAYAELESRFKEQVKQDNNYAKSPEGQGVYCPVREPTSLADFILVAMEPSIGGWAKGMQDAKTKIDNGFKNFDGFDNFCVCVNPAGISIPLQVFCHCIKRYLCQNGETFHLTDIAKGAMLVKGAAKERRQRYERWYHLLLKEIALVGQPAAPVIAVGKEVYDFLTKKRFEFETGRKLHHVVHYSAQAAGTQRVLPCRYPEDYERFISQELVGEQTVSEGLKDTPKHTRKKLMFTYKRQFEEIRTTADANRSQ